MVPWFHFCRFPVAAGAICSGVVGLVALFCLVGGVAGGSFLSCFILVIFFPGGPPALVLTVS